MMEDAVLAALNHLLNQADWARQRLAPFSGRHARVTMPPWRICVQVIEDGWFGVASDDTACDAEITFPADAPLLALRGGDKLIQAVRIEGNAQFAAELSFVLKGLRWDYEEDLSRLVGDIAAHRLAAGFVGLGDFGARLMSGAVARSPLFALRREQTSLAAGIADAGRAIANAEQRIAALARLAVNRSA